VAGSYVEVVEVAMIDWITWPANILLNVGGVVASWLINKDAPNFDTVQMMSAILVLVAAVSLIAYIQTLWMRFKQGDQDPSQQP